MDCCGVVKNQKKDSSSLAEDQAREAVRRKLAARLAGATDLEGTALEQAISDETGVRASRIHEAFYGGQPKDRRAFTQAMTDLQQLWRER